MHIYDVTVTYTKIDASSGSAVITTGQTIVVRKRAANPGMAATIVSSLFTQMGNFKDDFGNIWFNITGISVAPVIYTEGD